MSFDHFALDFALPQPGKQQQQQQQQPWDFYYPSHSQDILAPHPDSFDFDLDSTLAGEEASALQQLSVDPNPAFHFIRDASAKAGPPSAFTVSSESAYDTLSTYSESVYRSNYSRSSYAASDFSFPIDMDFDRIRLDTMSEYGSNLGIAQPTAAELEAAVNAAGFGLPPSPPYSPDSPESRQETFADYEKPFTRPATAIMSTSEGSPVPARSPSDDEKGDPRKKYKCAQCPRSFARAYNLKTHMATHDPNRLKPHVCPHHNCGRSFSRKHDLGRHLISIHRDEQAHAVGTQKGARVWCEGCGKSAVGQLNCDCANDV